MAKHALPLSPGITEAFEMARDVHNGMPIKGSTLPYLLHPLEVCSLALRYGADEQQAIGALLHDVVEDGGGAPMLDEIRSRFGDRVAEIVEACSDSFETDPRMKAPWWPRKIGYIDHLETASADAALVSGADKLSNVRSVIEQHAIIGDAVFDRFKTGRVGTLWYYRRIAEILPDRLSDNELSTRLGRVLTDTVDQMVAAVDTAATDWTEALEIERRERTAPAS